jgi:hypothetical protein
MQDGKIIEEQETKNIKSLEELYIRHIEKDEVAYPFIESVCRRKT